MTQPVILAVDDKADNLFVLSQCIIEYLPECRVITAPSAAEGLRIAGGTRLDAALIDLQMPGMDGIEMCRRLKAQARTARVPVIIMTAHRTSSKLRALALEAGADDFISKPVDNIELAARIKVILRIKQAEDSLRSLNERLEELVLERSLALRKSEASFQTVADALPVLIAHVDSDERYRFANATYEKLLNLRSADMIGRRVADVLGEPLYNRIRDHIQTALSGQPVEYEEKLPSRDGRWYDCHVRYVPQKAEGGKVTGFFVLAQDITERRQVEEERKATIELLRLMNSAGSLRELARQVAAFFGKLADCEAVGIRLRNGHDFPYFEARGFPPDFVQTESRLCAVDEFGQPVCDGAGRPVLECMCGRILGGRIEHSQPHITEFGSFWTNSTSRHLTSTGAAERLTLPRGRCNGAGYESLALIPLRAGDATFGLLQLNDRRSSHFTREHIALYERLAANLAISLSRRQSEDERLRLKNAVEQAQELFLLVDTNLLIRYVNPAFERGSGYQLEELAGRHLSGLATVNHGAAFKEEVWHRVRGGKTWSGRIECLNREGVVRECDATVSPIVDGSGVVQEFVIIMRDVSELVRLEKQLRQAQKMEAIGTLAGGIAHDFNNILAPIIGYTEMVRDELPADDPKHKDLGHVLTASYRARDLVKQILSFSRRTDQQRKPLLIGPIIKEAIKLLRSTLPSTIQIRENIPPGTEELTVVADPTQLHQILVNLCTNAAHAMREKGGLLEVSLSHGEADGESAQAPADIPPGPYARLSVSDTGQGMAPDVLQRIFEPFFTTKTPGEGTGLGLSVVYGIVKSHGGAIGVHSIPGQGSVFDIFLPATVEKAGPQKNGSFCRCGGNERILLVDDEREVAEMTRRLLERLQYQVEMKTDSVEAVEAFRSQPDRFDLVVTDQTMPRMTGVELAKELMRIRPDIPIVLCTGFSDLINEEQARAIGIRGFLMKPVALSRMAEAVRKAIESGGRLRQGPR